MKKLFVLSFTVWLMSCQGNSNSQGNLSEGSDSQKSAPEKAYEKSKYLGEWESVTSENLGNGSFAKRYFNLKEEDWEITFTLFLDSAQTIPVFAFRAVGKYEVQGASTIVDGADNAYFGFDSKYLTLLTDNEDVIQGFGFTNCGLEKGVEKDITHDGCSFLVSKQACGQEYDLLKLDNEQLFFGMRPSEGDMCTEENRPTALFYPLKKK